MKTITLTTGETVTFIPDYTHGADLAYSEVRFAEDYGARAPIHISLKACDAVLPIVIEKIEKAGETYKATPEWLTKLPLPDYEELYRLLLELRTETQARAEAGKKNT